MPPKKIPSGHSGKQTTTSDFVDILQAMVQDKDLKENESLYKNQIRSIGAEFMDETCTALKSCMLKLTAFLMSEKTGKAQMDLITQIYPLISKILNVISKTPSTLFTAYNHLITGAENKKKAKEDKVLWEDSDIHINKKKHAASLKNLYQDKVVQISSETIDNLIKRGLQDDATWTEKAISLAYASGGRPIEVLSNASAQFRKGANESQMIQKGRAKAKKIDEYLKFQTQEIVKTVNGMTWTQFEKLLSEVRDEVPQQDLDITTEEQFKKHVELNKIISQKYVSKMGKMSQVDVPALKEAYGRGGVYVARKSYSSSTYDPTTGGSLLGHARSMLGHTDANMSLHYSNVNVTRPVGAENVRTEELINNLNLVNQELKSLKKIIKIQNSDAEGLAEGGRNNLKLSNQELKSLKKIIKIQNSDAEGLAGGGRNICNPTRVIRQTNEIRSFLNDENEQVELPRFRKRIRLTEDEKMERMKQAEELLEQHAIPITAANLRNLGLGSKFTSTYRDQDLVGVLKKKNKKNVS